MEKWKTQEAAFSTFPQGLLREKEKETKQSGGGLTTALSKGPDGPRPTRSRASESHNLGGGIFK